VLEVQKPTSPGGYNNGTLRGDMYFTVLENRYQRAERKYAYDSTDGAVLRAIV
jgi:hypothetical protein